MPNMKVTYADMDLASKHLKTGQLDIEQQREPVAGPRPGEDPGRAELVHPGPVDVEPLVDRPPQPLVAPRGGLQGRRHLDLDRRLEELVGVRDRPVGQPLLAKPDVDGRPRRRDAIEDVRGRAGRQEDRVRPDFLRCPLKLDCQYPVIAVPPHPRHRRRREQLYPLRPHPGLDEAGRVRVLAGEDVRVAAEEGDVRAEPGERLGQLAADRSGPNNC